VSDAPFLFRWRRAFASEDGPHATVRAVLAILSFHMDQNGGSCHPSIPTLVEETGLSDRAVRARLQDAEAKGWIVRTSVGEDGGQGWRRYEYQAAIPGKVRQEVPQEKGERAAPHDNGAEPPAARKAEGAEYGSARRTEGAARHDKKVRQEVPANSSRELLTPPVVPPAGGDTHTGAAPRSRQRRSRAVQLPDEWSPNEKHHEIADAEGVDLHREVVRFRDWALANGRTQKDWDATFRNWLRNDRYRSKPGQRARASPNRYPGGLTEDEFIAKTQAELI
jgi:hypothetical protein